MTTLMKNIVLELISVNMFPRFRRIVEKLHMKGNSKQKIAIVVDWLVVYAGAERVLEQMLECYPEADVFAIVEDLPVEQRAFLKGKRVTTSFIQKLPFAKKKHRAYLPLMPFAVEQLDVTAYDIVISSSHAVAKGVITRPDQVHISYVHSPMRYAWDLQFQYLKEAGMLTSAKGWIARYFLHKLRSWDFVSSARVDHFIANSNYIAKRITKTYRREAEVLYPPVAVEKFLLNADKEDFYVTASRMVPYKKIPLIVEAFSQMPDKKLIVIGDGPEFEKAERVASENIQLLGYQPTDVLVDYLSRARAFVFAAIEDFGILPVEAQACGTPVIAYAEGGLLETVKGLDDESPTGVFYHQQTAEAIKEAVAQFEKIAIDPIACVENAKRFSADVFRERLMKLVTDKVSS